MSAMSTRYLVLTAALLAASPVSAHVFLEGKQEKIIRQLTKQMEEASDELEFERAAVFRDRWPDASLRIFATLVRQM